MSELRFEDLISPTLSSDEYLKAYKDKSIINKNFEDYIPESEIIEKIKDLIEKKHKKIKIVALGADWCPDCSLNVPHMIKIVKALDNDNLEFHILYGIMVNALHKPSEVIWHKKRSPPEAVDPKFNLKAIPTFYIFNSDGNLISLIVERPKHNSTLEKDFLEILEKNL